MRGLFQCVGCLLLLLILALSPSDLAAQAWGDGMYHEGMHRLMWGGQLPMVTVTGTVIVDSITTHGRRHGEGSHLLYFLDTAGTGARSYQLYFGPYWYVPASGVQRPRSGNAIAIRAGLYGNVVPPVLVVYQVGGQVWRDSTGAPPWAGRWVHRADSARVFCANDSSSWLSLPPGAIGTGMMDNGMPWPDSLFMIFERMAVDSLPFASSGWAFMGFHTSVFNPTGTSLMREDIPGLPRILDMEQPVRINIHVSPDTLTSRGITINQIRLLFLDVDSTWQDLPGQSSDSATSSIIADTPNMFAYLALTTGTAVSVEEEAGALPTEFSLAQNYPNPFNPKTVVGSQLPVAGWVKIVVYDLLGKEVAVLVNEWREAGMYRDTFDGEQLASAVYVYRMTAGSFTAARQMILLR